MGELCFDPIRCENAQWGFHKFGSIHFISKKRDRFVRACRYCAAVITGTVLDNSTERMISLQLSSKSVEEDMVEVNVEEGK